MPITDLEKYRVIDNINSYYRINSESKRELLLNKYPNAAAAYSLRLLDGYYRGPLVRIRRDDGVEVDVYPDYNNELSLDSLVSNVADADDTTTNPNVNADATFVKSLNSLGEFVSNPNYVDNGTAVNATVCLWYDQSSNNHAIQATLTNQPLIVSGGVIIEENGKPALDYTGSVNMLLRVASLNISQPSTVFIMAQGGTANRNFMDGVTITDRQTINTFNGYAYYAGATNVQITSTLDTNQHLFYALFNGANSEGGIDGNVAVSGNAGTQSLTGLTIGNSRENNDGCDGTMQEFVLYESDQSTNRTGIEEDINDYYQIEGFEAPQPLLDEFGGAAAAYSLRLLSSTYSGPLVRIRRDIDDIEVDVYPDSNGEFSKYSTIQDGGAELTTGVTGGTTTKTTLHEFLYGVVTNCFVVRWYDQSSGNHATQDVSTGQPKIYDSATGLITKNSSAAADFNGSQYLFTNSFATSSAGDWLCIGVASATAGATNKVAFGSDSSTRVAQLIRFASSNVSQTIGFNTSGTAVTDSGDSYVSDQQHLMTSRLSGGTLEVYLDSVSAGSTSHANQRTDSAQHAIGARGNNSDPHIGTIQEIILYPSDQSSNRVDIESNINTHYNIF